MSEKTSKWTLFAANLMGAQYTTLALKLLGLTTLNWWSVFAPIFALAGIVIVLLIVAGAAALVEYNQERAQ